jgi:DNA-binding CsgD family transcriptional regulator
MYTLNKNDYHDVFNLSNRCIACLKNGGNIKDILFEILRSFEADDAVFLSAGSNHHGVNLANSYVLRKERKYLDQYADYFWRYDPLYTIQFYAEPGNPAFKTDDVISYSQLVNLEYYNSFLRPQNLLGELIIRLYSKDNVFGAISLQRTEQNPNFAQKDTQKATLMAPFLSDIFEMADSFIKINDECTLMELWMESFSEGVFLLDSEFKPLYLNSKAKLFCLSMNGMSEKLLTESKLTKESIPQIVVQDCINLTRLQNNSYPFNTHSNRIISINPDKRYYLQYFSIIAPTSELPVPRFIIFLNELTKYGNNGEVIRSTEERLSEREENIAHYAALGLSNKQIAEKLCISHFTVQNHLKNIFEKTGLDSRTKLADLLKYSNSISLK